MPIGIYIHVPFCVRKCRYCDFISYLFNPGAAETYLDALSREIRLYGSTLPDEERTVTSLFIGGGTPTCLLPAGLKKILDEVRSSFYLLPGCEITVEANPGTVDAGGLRELLGAGVTRLSLGVQSFQDSLLKVLGRIHGAGEAVEAVRLAREAGFANLNLDFIFGIPGQTMEDWLETLNKALELAPDHIAAYGLQLEEGTPLAQAVARGEIKACPEELELSMYQKAIEFLNSSGYVHYEISSFARPGRQSAHNLGYWLNRPYLGLGPAAHSFLNGRRHCNTPSIEEYRRKLSRGECPVAEVEPIAVETEMAETMFLGLRLLEGVDLDQFYRRFGRRAEEVYRDGIARLAEEGLVELAGKRLRLTEKGLPVANRVFGEFV
ncbi:MAG: radical SAM family heme chaperone HemW [Peptococcaceae bacterium]|nr:radical SAM family heme chaperone HemW [Peptococcaceae bacterium]